MVTLNATQIEPLRQQRDAAAKAGNHARALHLNYTIRTLKVADLKRKIARMYAVSQVADGLWCVIRTDDGYAINDNDYSDPLNAEAEMEAVIQAEVKAEMEAEEFEEEAAS